ncbi:MAG: cytochrome c3 family protein [Kofleriaceae bacterium]
MIRTLIAIAIVAMVATVVHAQSVSPGPLARDHTTLEGIDNCVRCHSGGGGAINVSGCLSCHKALDQRLAAKAGYHAKLGNDCASCHPDHRGTSAALVKWPGDRDHFDHTLAAYVLSGGHAKVACRDCHKAAFLFGPIADALSADERPKTYLGLPTACVRCHADVHEPTLGTECTKCHDTASWRTRSTAFDHDKTKYPLVGAHVKVECTKCHGGTTQKLKQLHPAFDTCKTCHKDPHAGVMGKAATACATCHREAAWKELHYDRTSHAPRTLPLTAGHAKPACAACHGEKNDRMPAATCTPCHADPHKPTLGAKCETCHETNAWTKTSTKIEFHDRTTYPLRGLHVSVPCDKCHDPKKPTSTRFRPVAHGKCLDCHPDVHKGEASRPCEGCHNVAGWQPATFEVADHAKTRYVLEGAHRAIPCVKCHPASPKPSGFKRGNPSCETCHADPHGGQFTTPDRHDTCATCHDVVAWSPSTFTKEAHAKAGLALVGKHDVACGRCHTKTFVKLPADCGACHDDRHVGQFAGRACTTCHAGAVWKPTPGFDHAKSFVLRGRHAKAECARCHPKIARAGSKIETEVYKLGPASHDCVACHRAQHGDSKSGLDQPRRLAAATRACESCHGETTWRDVAIKPPFDHGTTDAPLVGGHAKTACSACHQPARRTLPALVDCGGCHQDRHAGRLGDRCERCHSPATWKPDQLLVDHQRTRLPLVGAHAVQPCRSCHKDAQAGTFRGLDPSCRSCHFHTVIDRRPHPDHTRDNGFLACENCHSVLGWRPAHIDHDKLYPLTGKHNSTPCVQCHKTGDPYNAAPSQCIGCHAADETRANAIMGGMHDTFGSACGDCHTTTVWTGTTFNHPAFPENHHASQCVNCHTTASMPQLYTCVGSGCHNSAQDGRPGTGHQGGDQNCARSGCHYGGAHGG